MLQLRLMEKKRELLRREDFDEAIDSIAGIVITHLSGLAARCTNDLTVRRKIDAAVTRFAERWRRPPLRWPMSRGSRHSRVRLTKASDVKSAFGKRRWMKAPQGGKTQNI
jgi:hypothetical protein